MAHGIAPPLRMASPFHGTQPHSPGTGSHERVPCAGIGKGCLGAPKWHPCVPHSYGDMCAWLGTTETAGHRGHSAPPPDTRSAPSPNTQRPNRAQTPLPPEAPRLGLDTSHSPQGTHRSRIGMVAGGLLAPRPGGGSQARSELPRADARCLCEPAHILRIPGSRPEIPQSYISHIWFQLGSGEGEPLTNPGWLFGGGYFPRPEGMCAKL